MALNKSYFAQKGHCVAEMQIGNAFGYAIAQMRVRSTYTGRACYIKTNVTAIMSNGSLVTSLDWPQDRTQNNWYDGWRSTSNSPWISAHVQGGSVFGAKFLIVNLETDRALMVTGTVL